MGRKKEGRREARRKEGKERVGEGGKEILYEGKQ